ncbi:MAG: DUF4349 domain-containing protein [Actinomycetota bacterium]|nr:DUF4349 domain-containing protein [Actinomycetota bacterium]
MRKHRIVALLGVVGLLSIILAAVVLGCGAGEIEESPGENTFSVFEDDWECGAGEETPLMADERAEAESYAALETGKAVEDVSSLPDLQLMVIRTALVTMEVEKGDYAHIKRDAVSVASLVGGYVESESSSRNDDGYTYASITLRVPAQNFDEVMTEVSSLGEVVSTQVNTSDVSSEYVDLESRLKHLEAEEAFYMDLIARAQTIEEMISIREHLSSIQLEKEQIQGRKDYLDQQISYSTLTLNVDEVSPDEEGEGFWHAVKEAFKTFGRGMRNLAIGLFYALPYIIIIAVLILLGWIIIRRSRRKKGQSGGEEHPQA